MDMDMTKTALKSSGGKCSLFNELCQINSASSWKEIIFPTTLHVKTNTGWIIDSSKKGEKIKFQIKTQKNFFLDLGLAKISFQVSMNHYSLIKMDYSKRGTYVNQKTSLIEWTYKWQKGKKSFLMSITNKGLASGVISLKL